MATEVEEHVVHADPLHAEHLVPQRGDAGLQLVARRDVGALLVALPLDGRQRLAVDLAVGVSGSAGSTASAEGTM